MLLGHLAPLLIAAVSGLVSAPDQRPQTPPMVAAHEAQPPDSVFEAWSPPEELKRLLERTLTRQSKPVRVFILDSGWPSDSTHRSSTAVLRAIVRGVSDYYRLGVSMPPIKEQWVKPSDPERDHASHIAEALAPLEALDPTDRVQLVYLPLARIGGSQELLELMYRTYFRLRHKESLLGRDGASAREVVVDGWGSVDRDAVRALKRLPETIVPDTIKTDVTLLDVLTALAGVDADLRKTPFLLNYSWTIPGNRYEPRGRSHNGLIVAAVGNGNRYILDDTRRVDFAGRAAREDAYLAVMNTDQDGSRHCRSSRFYAGEEYGSAAKVNGVSFNGMLPDAEGPCGTSFAAPRVAWLLAAAATGWHDNDRLTIAKTVARRLEKIRGDVPKRSSFYFQPARFFNATPVKGK